MSLADSMKTFALDVSSDLLARAVAEQEHQFTRHESLVQRILAVSASCTSIVSCLTAMYVFVSIDPRRFVFRHQLVFFLLFFDLLKACILLLYPSRVLTHYTAYYNDRFCQIVGFFTATAIEGADIAILSFAVHTFLLIFKPQLTVRVKNTDRTEGGLYRYRNYVYASSLLIPLVIASLAFIAGKGYYPYVCWCYLPQRPLWPRFVLSWVPRYIIVIIIFTVYGAIYIHVIREFKTLGGVFTTIHRSKIHNGIHPKPSHEKPSFYLALKYFGSTVRDHIFPKFVLPEEDKSKNLNPSRSQTVSPNKSQNHQNVDEHRASSSGATDGGIHIDTEDIIYDPEIQAANLESFRKRQKIIEKQMKSIFIYPFAYIFVWVFPFILQCSQFNYEESNGPIYWLNCAGAFMQPLNGFVDTLVFFYREQPWQYTIMKNFEKEHETKMNNIVMSNNPGGYVNDNESVATSARLTKNSLSASLGVDTDQYPQWRRILHLLRLPLMKLPTEDNVTKFQVKYLNNKIEEMRGSQFYNGGDGSAPGANTRSTAMSRHDFSNVLSGDINEKDFRNNLDIYTLNFSQDRRSSLSSLTQVGESKNGAPGQAESNSSNGSGTVNGMSSSSSSGGSGGDGIVEQIPPASNTSTNLIKTPAPPAPAYKNKSPRHISIADPNEPVIFEGKRYRNNTTSSQNVPPQNNAATVNAINLLNTIQQQRKQGSNSSASGSGSYNNHGTGASGAYQEPGSPTSPTASGGFPHTGNTPRRGGTGRQTSSATSRGANRMSYVSGPADDSDVDDMDFLEFLRRGP